MGGPGRLRRQFEGGLRRRRVPRAAWISRFICGELPGDDPGCVEGHHKRVREIFIARKSRRRRPPLALVFGGGANAQRHCWTDSFGLTCESRHKCRHSLSHQFFGLFRKPNSLRCNSESIFLRTSFKKKTELGVSSEPKDRTH